MLKLCLPFALLALACEVQGLDVGHDAAGSGSAASNGGSAGSGGSASAVIPRQEPAGGLESQDGCATDAELAKFVGVWEGSVQDFSFNPITSVRIEIDGASRTGGICGTIRVGDDEPLPPPADPDASYPPSGASSREMYPGHTYRIASGGAQGSSLHLGVRGFELWSDWCALQAPVFDPEGEAYPGCVENLPMTVDEASENCVFEGEDGPIVHPYGKCMLCLVGPARACDCTADGCHAMPEVTIQFSFELGESDEGTPTLSDASGAPNRLTLLERLD